MITGISADNNRDHTEAAMVTDRDILKTVLKELYGKDIEIEYTDAFAEGVAEHIRTEKEHFKHSNTIDIGLTWTLVAAIDAKDEYTAGHSERVADLSYEIAKRYGKPMYDLKKIHYSALLHDIGKIGIPDSIINKKSRLDDSEYDIIRSHPMTGYEILSHIEDMEDVATGARWHHERYDGKGYPDGLKGEDIPEIARIIGTADAYDAMTSKRSYRDVMPQQIVRAEIEKGLGTQFDPVFGRIMLQIIDDDKEYALHG